MKSFLSFLLLLLTYSGIGQNTGDITLEGGMNYISMNQLNSTQTFGAELNWFVADNFSLDYGVHAGKKYVHIPASVPITLKLFSFLSNEEEEEEESDSTKSSSKWSALLALLIPEGVSGHVNVGSKTYLSPTIRPLGFDLIGKDSLSNNQDANWYLANEMGLKLKRQINHNWFVSVYGGLKNSIWRKRMENEPRDFRFGYSFGVKIGGVIGRF